MIDPDCNVCLGIGWVYENHPNWAVSAARECPVNVFALTVSKSLTLVRYLKKDRQHEISVSPFGAAQAATLGKMLSA